MDDQQQSLIGAVKHKEYNLLITPEGGVFNMNGTKRYVRQNNQGYLKIQVRVNGRIINLVVHRLVAETFLPPPPRELIEKCSKEHWGKVLVLHNDNNKLNNHISNLRWGSLKDNTLQAFDDGLVPFLKGELNGRARLSEKEVHELCKFFEEGHTAMQATKIFNVNMNQASKIRCGNTWKHVSCQYDIKPIKKQKLIKNVQRPAERRSSKWSEMGDS